MGKFYIAFEFLIRILFVYFRWHGSASFVLCRDWLLSSPASILLLHPLALLSVSHRSSEVFVPVLSNDRERGFCELIDGEGEIFAELFK